jgi:peptide/nickel transport system substrate-binding protein
MMVSTKAAASAGDDFARKPVGTGPFQFVEWVKDDHMLLRKYDKYWEKDANGVQLPYLNEVSYKPIPDGSQRLTALKTGTVDIVDGPNAKDIPGLKNAPDLVLSEVPGLAYRYIRINMTKAPLDNKALRQAMAWAIDREAINKVVFFGFGSPAYQGIPPSSFAFDPDFHPFGPRDLDKAKAKLAESGVKDPTFSVLVVNTGEDRQVGEVIKEQLGDAGITMNIELVDGPTLTDRGLKGDFQATISQWSGRADPDGNLTLQFNGKSNQNQSRYANPETDRLLEAARGTYDQAERKKLYSQANEHITDDVPMVFIQHRAEVKVMLPRLVGFVHVPDGMIRVTQLSLKS